MTEGQLMHLTAPGGRQHQPCASSVELAALQSMTWPGHNGAATGRAQQSSVRQHGRPLLIPIPAHLASIELKLDLQGCTKAGRWRGQVRAWVRGSRLGSSAMTSSGGCDSGIGHGTAPAARSSTCPHASKPGDAPDPAHLAFEPRQQPPAPVEEPMVKCQPRAAELANVELPALVAAPLAAPPILFLFFFLHGHGRGKGSRQGRRAGQGGCRWAASPASPKHPRTALCSYQVPTCASSSELFSAAASPPARASWRWKTGDVVAYLHTRPDLNGGQESSFKPHGMNFQAQEVQMITCKAAQQSAQKPCREAHWSDRRRLLISASLPAQSGASTGRPLSTTERVAWDLHVSQEPAKPCQLERHTIRE